MGTQPDILTVGEFEAVVLREFGFLQREYGFRHTADEQLPLATFPRVRFPIADEPTARLDYRVTSVTFESAAVGVEVLNDPRGEIECVLWLGTDSPTTSVSLWRLLSHVGMPGLTNRGWIYDYGHATLANTVASVARALESYGAPWLRGDAERWAALLAPRE